MGRAQRYIARLPQPFLLHCQRNRPPPLSIDNMNLFKYIVSLFVLFAAVTSAKGDKPCFNQCNNPGELFCDYDEQTNIHYLMKCGNNGCIRQEKECKSEEKMCIASPTPHCTSNSQACAGCDEYFTHCKSDYWAACPKGSDCEKVCIRKTCEMDGGKCRKDCGMLICKT